jgi:peroxiredoxin family protein
MEELQRQIDELRSQMENHLPRHPANRLSMVVFSGDLDKLLAAFIIATGAAAADMEVKMFFTFWALSGLRSPEKKEKEKNAFAKMIGWMMPKGASKAKLSKMNMGGMGTAMMARHMKKNKVMSLPELIDLAADLEVKITACQMTLDLMGFQREELIDYPDLDVAGVADFLRSASGSKVTLFI